MSNSAASGANSVFAVDLDGEMMEQLSEIIIQAVSEHLLGRVVQ